MSPCSRCRGPREKVDQRYCRSCKNASARENRPEYRHLTEEQRRRGITRSYSRVLEKRGKLKRQPCACGERAERHHPDYSDPRRVEWLCRDCHRGLHLQEQASRDHAYVLARIEQLHPIEDEVTA